MKTLLIFFFFLFPLTLIGQRDSSEKIRCNVVSVEVGGGSYYIFPWGNPFNLGYHRIIRLRNNEQLQLGIRIGVGTSKARISPPPELIRQVFIPIEASLLIGRRWCKGEVGIGFTPIFGKNYFTAESSTGQLYFVRTNTYQFLTARVGICAIPMRRVPVYLRLAWTPAYVLPPNKIPYETLPHGWRYKPLWGSLTLGFAF